MSVRSYLRLDSFGLAAEDSIRLRIMENQMEKKMESEMETWGMGVRLYRG